MTLKTELTAFKACMLDRLGPAQAEIAMATERQMAESNLGQHVPRVGDIAPDFTLPDQHDTMVNLYEALRTGPVALTFYRGGWCPFSMLTLRAWQRQWAGAKRIPATIMGISPQDVPTTQATAETHGITFPLLADHGAAVGKTWSLMYQVPEAMRPIYERLGHVLPKMNECGTWAIPLSATFVIAPDHRIVHADVTPMVHVRMEPAEAMAMMRKLPALQPAQ